MNQKFHPPGSDPIIVNGLIVQPGSFYAPPKGHIEIVTTDNAAKEQTIRPPFLSSPTGLSVGGEGHDSQPTFKPPAYDSVTVNEMKTQLEAWGVDYSEQDKDKPTLYAFYVEEARRHAESNQQGS
ncbi:hypothetical protein CIG75_12790 [Tumebacillus algifaecis]|uniref:Uncharacterized protein n=1 Tax=Tumebacillus algifaecis TaxID=1214604 RepID=A0A223D316_9BACL|nr:hypothetical protein [Tumebacillus algifaecis]ASS75776.1 hypothetical protein CIG75_12790 [Tumebacillus algifaecis]